MGTFDGLTLRLYVNGIEHGWHKLAAASSCTSNAAVEIGGKSGLSASQFFNGSLDEVVVYGRALTDKQVRELYLYQFGWVEDRQSHEITVDNDPPTVEILMENGSYLPNRRTWVGVIAGDATAAVETVELSRAESRWDQPPGFAPSAAPKLQVFRPGPGVPSSRPRVRPNTRYRHAPPTGWGTRALSAPVAVERGRLGA